MSFMNLLGKVMQVGGEMARGMAEKARKEHDAFEAERGRIAEWQDDRLVRAAKQIDNWTSTATRKAIAAEITERGLSRRPSDRSKP